MKNTILHFVILGILWQCGLYGQGCAITENLFYNTRNFYAQGDELWLNDSIVYFMGNGQDWIPAKRVIVKNRDAIGHELSSYIERYNEASAKWEALVKKTKSYYYFGSVNFLKESKTFSWDDHSAQWKLTEFLEYDTNGDILSRSLKTWDDSKHGFSEGTRELFTYDGNRNLLTVIEENWVSDVGEWQKKYRNSYLTEMDSRRKINHLDTWDEDNASWTAMTKTVDIVDAAGNPLKHEVISYDVLSGSVEGTESLNYSYNDKGEIKEKIKTVLVSEGVKKFKESFRYNKEGTLVKKMELYQNPNSTNWILARDFSYTYNSDNLKTNARVRVWDVEKEDWSSIEQVFYLNKDGKVIRQLNRVWDFQEMEWVFTTEMTTKFNGDLVMTENKRIWKDGEWNNISRSNYSYDDQNRITKRSEMEWDDATETWQEIVELKWLYDPSGNVYEFYTKNWNGEEWENKSKSTFGWHMFALTRTDSKESYTIEVFPNPTKGVLYIKSVAGALSRIAILDQYGRLIEAISIDQTSHTIDIFDLPPGNYYIECKNSVAKNTFKVVKL